MKLFPTNFYSDLAGDKLIFYSIRNEFQQTVLELVIHMCV